MENYKQILNWYKMMGVEEICLNEAGMLIKNISLAESKNIEAKPLKNQVSSSENNSLAEIAREMAEQCSSLDELRKVVTSFDKLEITKTATNTVFADGNPNSKIMVIGEAPGANEDEEGIPFCGMSGKLLDQVFRSINLDRATNIYITNSIFWRPPGNRKPTALENEVCLPFVEKHIAIMNPKLLILVGSTSATALLQTTDTISRLRSKFYNYQNRYLEKPIPTAVIFHPSYLLRQPQQKKTVWFDLLRIKKEFL